MIAVVHFLQFSNTFIMRHTFHICKCCDLWLEIFFQFFLSNATDSSIVHCQRNICKLIQIRENRHLREFRYTCEKYESEVTIHILKYREEGLVQSTIFLFLLRIRVHGVKQWLVVFINENYDLTVGFVVKLSDKIFELYRQRSAANSIFASKVILMYAFLYCIIKYITQSIFRLVFPT